MKKLLIVLFTLASILFIAFIYSCNKENSHHNSAINSGISDSLLEGAKNWYGIETHTKSSAGTLTNNVNQKDVGFAPNWDYARLIKLKSGKELIVVPAPDFNFDTSSKKAFLRKFVFSKSGNEITGGALIELYGNVDYIQKNRSGLFEQYIDENAASFTGSAIFYDVNYKYLTSNVLVNGKSVGAKSGIYLTDAVNHGKTGVNSIDPQILGTQCYDYYFVTYWSSGDITREYLYRGCTQDGVNGSEGSGGGSSAPPITVTSSNANQDYICPSSFSFHTFISLDNGVGGWQIAATNGIHMNVANLETGQLINISLPTIYFGLPIIRTDGTFYSTSQGQNIAVQAVQYGEGSVMGAYHNSGGSLDVVGMQNLYRQKVNEYMARYAGSATLYAGANMNVTDIRSATYGWPIIGCL